MAASAASRSPILSSSGTTNGSSTTAVSNRPWAGGRPSSTTGRRSAVADAKPLALVEGDARQDAALDVDRLFETPDDPHVGVGRSPASGGVERPVGDLAHSETVAGVSGLSLIH